jgi:hypothetical protein
MFLILRALCAGEDVLARIVSTRARLVAKGSTVDQLLLAPCCFSLLVAATPGQARPGSRACPERRLCARQERERHDLAYSESSSLLRTARALGGAAAAAAAALLLLLRLLQLLPRLLRRLRRLRRLLLLRRLRRLRRLLRRLLPRLRLPRLPRLRLRRLLLRLLLPRLRLRLLRLWLRLRLQLQL